MEMKNIIRIAIADDHVLMREGLVKQLSSDPGINVIIEARHGLDMLQQLEKVSELPDIAIVDLKMPVMDGFALTDELKKKYPQIAVLILSAYTSEYNVAAMISKGVRGYLLKECSPTEFSNAIYSIYATGYYYSVLADEQVFKMLQRSNVKATNIPERQMELLKYCATELRYDQIAEKMGVSLSTLKGYREELFGRIGVNSRAAAVMFAMRSGITLNETYQPNKLKIKY